MTDTRRRHSSDDCRCVLWLCCYVSTKQRGKILFLTRDTCRNDVPIDQGVCLSSVWGLFVYSCDTRFVSKTFPSLLYINYSNDTYMILHSSAAMLDAVFAEVQQVFHQSMEFPLHCLSHMDVLSIVVFIL